MIYPGGNAGQVGEQVSYSYYPQMTLKNLLGSNGAYYYLQSGQYDAAGRTDLLKLGAASLGATPVLQTDYEYFAWNTLNGLGRLKRILSQDVSPLTTLQDLRYYHADDFSPTYDAVGNLLYIYDYTAGSPQTQTFSYDALDRLHTAQSDGSLGLTGAYNQETYDYDTAGRLAGMPGLGTYTYSTGHPHAVEKIAGVTKYTYDSNGNMTQRIYGANTYNLSYDAENRLTGVSGAATDAYGYDGDGQRVKEVSYENLAAGLPFTSDTSLYWPEVIADNDTYANSGSGSSGEFAYTGGTGLHYVQVDLGAVYTVDRVKVWHYYNDGRTYSDTMTQVSADGINWTTVFDSAESGEYAESAAGKTHTFTARSVRYVRDYLNGSTANGGNHWVEIEVFGSKTTLHLGDYFEWTGSTSTMVKYYYAGGARIAMRVGTGSGTTGLYWLLSDHLGSTAIVADGATGAKLSELRYKPWGELRYASGVTLTGLRYTGQRAEGVGLYDYGARFYDPSIGRFVSADSIVPGAGNPIAWDRYAGMGNNPVSFTDPTGHCAVNKNGRPSDPDRGCWGYWKRLGKQFPNVYIDPLDFNLDQLKLIGRALRFAQAAFKGQEGFAKAVGYFAIDAEDATLSIFGASGSAPPWWTTISLSSEIFSMENYAVHTILHEIGHRFDFYGAGGSPDDYRSQRFVRKYSPGCNTGDLGCISDEFSPLFYKIINILTGGGAGGYTTSGVTSDYGRTSSTEDFAESFYVYVMLNVSMVPDIHVDSRRLELMRKIIKQAIR